MFPPGPFPPVSSENRNGTIADEDEDDEDDDENDDDENDDDENDDDENDEDDDEDDDDEGGKITCDIPDSNSYDSSSFPSMRHHV